MWVSRILGCGLCCRLRLVFIAVHTSSQTRGYGSVPNKTFVWLPGVWPAQATKMNLDAPRVGVTRGSLLSS